MLKAHHLRTIRDIGVLCDRAFRKEGGQVMMWTLSTIGGNKRRRAQDSAQLERERATLSTKPQREGVGIVGQHDHCNFEKTSEKEKKRL